MKQTVITIIVLFFWLTSVGYISAQTVDKQGNKINESNAAAPNVVKSLNELTGDLNLLAGPNVTITPNGKNLTISAPNTLSTVSTDTSLVGNGTPADPLRVAALPDAGGTPITETVAFQIPANLSAEGAALMTVPAGKRLIVEYASGRCFAPPGQFVYQFEISFQGFALPKRGEQTIAASLAGTDSVLGGVFTASAPVRLYVDAGYTAQVLAWRAGGVNGTVSCRFNYSGTLVNQL